MQVGLVSAIIVTTGASDYLPTCLSSLKEQKYPKIETIVVDSKVQNLSYCSALNQGISKSNGEFVLCLNDDVVLSPEFINETYGAVSAAHGVGLASGKIMRFDRKRIDSTGLLLGLCRTANERDYNCVDYGEDGIKGEIFGVCGAVAFYRREMLNEIMLNGEYFDSDFRFFYEDLDVAWRAQNRGWKAYYVPTAIAYHARGGTARKKQGIGKMFARFYISDELQLDLIKNRYLTIIKNETLLGFLLHFPFMLFYDVAVFGFLLVFRPKVIPKLLDLPKYMKSAFRKRFAAKGV